MGIFLMISFGLHENRYLHAIWFTHYVRICQTYKQHEMGKIDMVNSTSQVHMYEVQHYDQLLMELNIIEIIDSTHNYGKIVNRVKV